MYCLLPCDDLGLVVPGQPVDPGLDENEAELGVLVFAAPLQVLADGDGFLDEEVDVLWKVGGKSLPLEDTQDLVTSHETDLDDNVGTPQNDTNLK